jgi:uncharacterized protein YecA (UPF0149 family)
MTQAFLDSPEAAALDGVPAEARAEIADRLYRALADVGRPLAKLASSEVHEWLLHAVPDYFRARDPLAEHVAPVLRAMLDFTERDVGRKLGSLRSSCESLLPELEDALVHGHAHHHHHHGHDDAPPATYVRESPKVGRNDPCPCGSGKKFKKCHGA